MKNIATGDTAIIHYQLSIINSIKDLIMDQQTIFALGFFDGVHLGHQGLLKACRELAKQNHCLAGAVTFAAHPDALVLGNAPALVNTISNRVYLLKQFGMDTVVMLPFDEKMRSMPWGDFIQMLQREFGAAGFVCGHDFRFGHRGEGTAAILREYCNAAGLPCAVVPKQVIDGVTVSSTHIRGLIADGQMAQAVKLLGHPHILSGVVVEGKQLGRTLGFPTANLSWPEGVLIPKFGVYACKVGDYPAVVNIGTRPTVNGQNVNAECHLLDFAGDLYGKEITVAFYGFIRPEQKFDSLKELKSQIAADTAKVSKML